MFMATKTLTIMEDAYSLLLKQKRTDESFSDVIRRVASKPDIIQLAGTWSAKTAKAVQKEVSSLRKHSTKELYDRTRFYSHH